LSLCLIRGRQAQGNGRECRNQPISHGSSSGRKSQWAQSTQQDRKLYAKAAAFFEFQKFQ
jgi:hypothetical protein